MHDLQTLIRTLAEAGNVFVEDIRLSETGGTIKVVCDTEEGITSEELVAVSRRILEDQVYDGKYAGHYRLEVSSPGVDMLLKERRHFRKNKGRTIELHHSCEEYKNPIQGVISEVDDNGITISVKIKKEEQTLHIPFDKVEYAGLKLKW